MAKRVPRTRNNGSMTEAAFWGWIRAALRNRSRFWKPVAECKKKARRKYQGKSRRQKWEYQCANCKNWFPAKSINVDHIVPAGTLRCSDDLKGFVERLFCEVDGLQCLCNKCHDKKTKLERDEAKTRRTKQIKINL